MYMYNWFTLLYTWNQHNIVNLLYSNKNFLKNYTQGAGWPWLGAGVRGSVPFFPTFLSISVLHPDAEIPHLESLAAVERGRVKMAY